MMVGDLTTGAGSLRRARAGFLALVLLAAGCQSPDLAHLARDSDLRLLSVVETNLPQRYLLRRQVPPGDRLRVYLGGDGRPWRDRRPATAPTGRRQLGLQLFLADAAAGAYLGRPCYQVETESFPECTPDLWTSARYGERVVRAMHTALESVRREAGVRKVELVGYSGGGTLALLLAARDRDVERVLTVAPLLDPPAWTAHHGLLPLTDSLSPLDANRTGAFSEAHLLGELDSVVPPHLAATYAEHFPAARFSVVDGFDHQCCWLQHWPDLLERIAPRGPPD
jgi:hypothetical protein